MIISCVLSLLLLIEGIRAVNGTEDWTIVDQLSIFDGIDRCSQGCVRNVNSEIFDVRQNTTCRSQGCVCSDNTTGINFLNGQSKVALCALKNCSTLEQVNSTVEGYTTLCSVFAINGTRPPTPAGKTM